MPKSRHRPKDFPEFPECLALENWRKKGIYSVIGGGENEYLTIWWIERPGEDIYMERYNRETKGLWERYNDIQTGVYNKFAKKREKIRRPYDNKMEKLRIQYKNEYPKLIHDEEKYFARWRKHAKELKLVEDESDRETDVEWAKYSLAAADVTRLRDVEQVSSLETLLSSPPAERYIIYYQGDDVWTDTDDPKEAVEAIKLAVEDFHDVVKGVRKGTIGIREMRRRRIKIPSTRIRVGQYSRRQR